MGRNRRLLVAPSPNRKRVVGSETALRRRKPRSYLEWKTLSQWNKLPPWEEAPPGYLLRRLREEAGCSQQELAMRLGSSQQAVAQAERWGANPTLKFVREWARALGLDAVVSFEKSRRQRDGRGPGVSSPG